jgi:hypothetical protein
MEVGGQRGFGFVRERKLKTAGSGRMDAPSMKSVASGSVSVRKK